jgi:acetoin utilization deacetylase AcuC-like enzyme
MANELKNAFVATRPPGHHAGFFHDKLAGFCVYNNIAIGVRHARNVHGVKKILVFDWDIHHGDGT